MKKDSISELQVGDYMQLPEGEWHVNGASKQVWRDAQDYAADNIVNQVRPQYQIETNPKEPHKAVLQRIR